MARPKSIELNGVKPVASPTPRTMAERAKAGEKLPHKVMAPTSNVFTYEDGSIWATHSGSTYISYHFWKEALDSAYAYVEQWENRFYSSQDEDY
jgi:hypothetical protein